MTPVNVRFGSKADIGAPPIDVRFTPKSGHCLAVGARTADLHRGRRSLTSVFLPGMNNGVLYRCNSNCERIFDVATDCLLWLAPAAIQQSNRCLNACCRWRFWLLTNTICCCDQKPMINCFAISLAKKLINVRLSYLIVG